MTLLPPRDSSLRATVALLVAFLALFAASLLRAPASNSDLVLHHIPTVLFVAFLCWHGRTRRLDLHSYACITIFLLIHVVGARYTYSEVPYDAWTHALTGVTVSNTFDFQRNHYDRLVHFAFGALMLVPGSRLLAQRVTAARADQVLLGIGLVVVAGAVYELLEWAIAVSLSPTLADRYNGQQGDLWDAQKDQALNLAGALVTAAMIASKWQLTRSR
ncbi:MAG: DUF2238 domain-containing protein [Planctomycetota bacterium]